MAASRSPKVVREAATATCVVDANTTFVQADPTTFRALVQKLTGAAPAADGGAAETKLPPKPQEDDDVAAVTVAHAPPPPPRRPKLQERRRAAPARLELSRPKLVPSPSSPFYYYHHAHGAHHHGAHVHGLMHSPVSPMDAYVMLAAASSASPSLSSSSSMTPSPHSSSPSCGGAVVMISREEEEREEKAIASKGFYLHASPRGDGADRPKLLPLFPVHSPARINELRRGG